MNAYENELRIGLWPSLAGLILALLAITAMEAILAHRGYQPIAKDTAERWAAERRRASVLGPRAVIIVGTSRGLMGIDTATLAETTGRVPVQLAIDGSTYEAVLESLAADPEVQGLILVTHNDSFVLRQPGEDRASEYAAYYHKIHGQGLLHYFTSAWSDDRLEYWRALMLRSYADGARPMSTLFERVINSHSSPQYRVIEPDRSIAADFSRIDQREAYLSRVARNLRVERLPEERRDPAAFEHRLQSIVSTRQALDASAFSERIELYRRITTRLQSHGAQVIYITMPVSGMLLELSDRLFPRSLFWDPFVRQVGAGGIHFQDDPELDHFRCPDGSHLDIRDRAPFTRALIAVARRRGLL